MRNLKNLIIIGLIFIFASALSSCLKEPTACFTVKSTHINLGDTISFINCSSDAKSYAWDFGDGQTSTQSSPQHIYSEIGNFPVSLTAYSEGEKKKDNVNLTITVKGGACFTISSYTSYTGDSLKFTNCSIMCQSYEWNFGDGNSSSDINPVHVYQQVGNYTITLHATLNNGQNSEVTDEVTILQAPKGK
ncbi:MAG: PKD domain-containing protein [Bacteroidia bacterium]|nr:PKD domain-containing protein [Bacteroidia bacterium]